MNVPSLLEEALLFTARELLRWRRLRPTQDAVVRKALAELPRVLEISESIGVKRYDDLLRAHHDKHIDVGAFIAAVTAMAKDVEFAFIGCAPDHRNEGLWPAHGADDL